MCGRYTLRRVSLIYSDLHATPEPGFEEFSEQVRFNIAPSQKIPVVRLNKGGRRVVSWIEWGLVPYWTKGKPGARPINARAETVGTSATFREAFGRRRCLVPADGFYEWRKLDAKTKQPMFMHFADDRLFAFAGLWERWKPGEKADPVDTCTIITTTPNTLMAPIHDRMPVILRPEDYAAWLDRDTPPTDAAAMLKPYPDGELQALPVRSRVNNPRNDTAECIEPLAESEPT